MLGNETERRWQMNKRVTYKVSWKFGGRAEESRQFNEWEPAAQFYAGLLGDRRCDLARLVEVTEAEVRCFEREAARGASARDPVGSRRQPGEVPGKPARKARSDVAD